MTPEVGTNPTASIFATGDPEISMQVRDIQKSFRSPAGREMKILDGISFDLKRGSIMAIIGPSGCGKTTLLKIMAGLEPTGGGSVSVADSGAGAEVGFVWQVPNLLPWMSVWENVALPLRVGSGPAAAGKAEARRQAEQQLALVGLEGTSEMLPRQLSGGMQQRVAMARAVAGGASVLMMDEPFGALDEFTREQLDGELLRIVRATDTACVLVTHSIEEALFVSDEILVLSSHPGRIQRRLRSPFGHPRDPEIKNDAAFFELQIDIRNMLAQR